MTTWNLWKASFLIGTVLVLAACRFLLGPEPVSAGSAGLPPERIVLAPLTLTLKDGRYVWSRWT